MTARLIASKRAGALEALFAGSTPAAVAEAPRWAHVRAYSEVERLTETDDAPAGGFAWDGRFDGRS